MPTKDIAFQFLGRPVVTRVLSRGLFGGSMADGHRVDVLKPLEQKAIRRGDLKRAVGAVARLAAFDQDPDTGLGSSAITANMINRIPVIAAEDVGLGNAHVLPCIDDLVTGLRRRRAEARAAQAPYDPGPPLVEALRLLCPSTKCRLASHVRAAFGPCLDDGRSVSLVPGLVEALALLDRMSAAAVDLGGTEPAGWEARDLHNLRRVAWLLRYAHELPNSPITKFLGARYLCELHQSRNRYKVLRGYPVPRKANSSPVHLAWQLMRARVAGTDRANVVDTCYRWYLGESEPHTYLVLAYIVSVEPEIRPAPAAEPCFPEELLTEALSAPLDVPDWVVDMHTAPGRKKGRSSADFGREGCVVDPELLVYPELKAIYVASKVAPAPPAAASLAAAVPAPPARITDELRAELLSDSTPHGQLVTSRSKQPTYLPVQGELAGFVWKGPYRADGGKLAWIQFRAECFRRLGTPACPARVVPDDNGSRWCCYPNVSPVPPGAWRLLRREDRCLGKEVLLVDRASLQCVRLIDCDLATVRDVLFGGQRMIEAVLDAAVLCTGDVHLVNLLYTGTACWLVDYEEVTSRAAVREVGHLFAKPPRKATLRMIEDGCREELHLLEGRLRHIRECLPDVGSAADRFAIPARMQQHTGRPFRPEQILEELEALVAGLQKG